MVEAKTGGEELNGSSGAQDEPKAKRTGADEEKKKATYHPRDSTIIGPDPPLGRSTRCTYGKKCFHVPPVGARRCFCGGLEGRGRPKGPASGFRGPPVGLGAALEGPLGKPWGAEVLSQRAILENKRPCKVIGSVI